MVIQLISMMLVVKHRNISYCDIPQAHPMAILNNGIEDKISYKVY